MKLFFLFSLASTLFSCTIQEKPKTQNITIEGETSKSIDFDSTYLKIYLNNPNFIVSILNKKYSTNNIDSLESFINRSTTLFDPTKILIIGYKDASRFDSTKLFLKKNGIIKFFLSDE